MNNNNSIGASSANPCLNNIAIDLSEKIIGCLIQDFYAIGRVDDILSIDLFPLESHQIVIRVIKDLHQQQKQIDMTSLVTELTLRGDLKKIGGEVFLWNLFAKTVSAVNVDQYVLLLTEAIHSPPAGDGKISRFKALELIHEFLDSDREPEQLQLDLEDLREKVGMTPYYWNRFIQPTLDKYKQKNFARETETRYQAYRQDLLLLAHEPDQQRRKFMASSVAQKYRISRSDIQDGILSVLGMAPPQTEVTTAGDLLNQNIPSGQFLVPGVPSTGVTLLAGQPGAGKTTFAYHLAKAVNEGKDWFGEKPTQTGKVVFVSSDETKADAKDKAEKLGFDGDDITYVFNWQVKDWEIFEKTVKGVQPPLVVVDSFTGIHDAAFNENERSAAATILRLQQLCEQYGCAVLLLHHLSKSGQVRGSTTITSTPSSVLILEGRGDETRHLYSQKCRGEYVNYRFDIEWDLSLRVVSGEVSEQEKSIKQTVLDLLKGVSQHLEIEEIANLANLAKKQVSKALNSLKAFGLVGSERSQINQKRKVYFVLQPDLETPPQSSQLDVEEKQPETTTHKELQSFSSTSPGGEINGEEKQGETNGETVKPKPDKTSNSVSPQQGEEPIEGGADVAPDCDVVPVKVGQLVQVLFSGEIGKIKNIDRTKYNPIVVEIGKGFVIYVRDHEIQLVDGEE
ncbi:MAG: AAA family ATPase [Cyanobacteria bacterium J06592_8]